MKRRAEFARGQPRRQIELARFERHRAGKIAEGAVAERLGRPDPIHVLAGRRNRHADGGGNQPGAVDAIGLERAIDAARRGAVDRQFAANVCRRPIWRRCRRRLTLPPSMVTRELTLNGSASVCAPGRSGRKSAFATSSVDDILMPLSNDKVPRPMLCAARLPARSRNSICISRSTGPATKSLNWPAPFAGRHDAIEAKQLDQRRAVRRLDGAIDTKIGGGRLFPVAGHPRAGVEMHGVEIAVHRQPCVRFAAVVGDVERAVQFGVTGSLKQIDKRAGLLRHKFRDQRRDRRHLPRFEIERERAARRGARRYRCGPCAETAAAEIGNRQFVDLQSAGIDLQPRAGIARDKARRRWRGRYRRQSSCRAAARRSSRPAAPCRIRARRRDRVRAH